MYYILSIENGVVVVVFFGDIVKQCGDENQFS